MKISLPPIVTIRRPNHSIYKFSNEFELEHVHTFFVDWKNSSEGFGFSISGDKFAVSYPNELVLQHLVDGKIKTIWSKSINSFPSEYHLSDLVFIDDSAIALGKGKKLMFYHIADGSILKEMGLRLSSEISGVFTSENRDTLIARTRSELNASHGYPTIYKHLKKYKRQYFGYHNINEGESLDKLPSPEIGTVALNYLNWIIFALLQVKLSYTYAQKMVSTMFTNMYAACNRLKPTKLTGYVS